MSFPQKLRVIIYCRFSKEEQRHQSIEAQKLFCEKFLRELGIDAEIIMIPDEGLSGELRSRPGIDRVRQLIESGLCDVLIAEDSSRLFRDIGYCLDLVGTAVDLKVRVICPNDDVDTSRKDWRKRLTGAQIHHTEANEYTRSRLARTILELWASGSAVGLLRPGYQRRLRDAETRRSTKVDEINPVWLPVIQSA
ncbi:MAG: recombinase family protein [Planctomycetaceae bacterium]